MLLLAFEDWNPRVEIGMAIGHKIVASSACSVDSERCGGGSSSSRTAIPLLHGSVPGMDNVRETSFRFRESVRWVVECGGSGRGFVLSHEIHLPFTNAVDQTVKHVQISLLRCFHVLAQLQLRLRSVFVRQGKGNVFGFSIVLERIHAIVQNDIWIIPRV